RVGFGGARPFEEGRSRLGAWLADGLHGDMGYLATGEDRADASALLASVKTLVSVALPYAGRPVPLKRARDGEALVGIVARYAVGADYHRVLKDKLEALAHTCESVLGRRIAWRACVDTAPLLEREAAARTGL